MNVSELIAKLKDLQDTYGDVAVAVTDERDDANLSVASVKAVDRVAVPSGGFGTLYHKMVFPEEAERLVKVALIEVALERR